MVQAWEISLPANFSWAGVRGTPLLLFTADDYSNEQISHPPLLPQAEHLCWASLPWSRENCVSLDSDVWSSNRRGFAVWKKDPNEPLRKDGNWVFFRVMLQQWWGRIPRYHHVCISGSFILMGFLFLHLVSHVILRTMMDAPSFTTQSNLSIKVTCIFLLLSRIVLYRLN